MFSKRIPNRNDCVDKLELSNISTIRESENKVSALSA
jgi:hypothetical protein